jgi:hypothetical protein
MIRERMLAAAASNTAIQAQGGHADALQWAAIWADLGLPKIFWVENLPVTFASLTYNPEGLDLPLIPAGVRKSDAGACADEPGYVFLAPPAHRGF